MARKILLSVIVLVSFFACDSDNPLDPSFKATVKGGEWKSFNHFAVEANNTLTITGIAEDGKTLSISVLGTGEGEYRVVDNTWEANFGAYYKATEFDEITDAWTAYHGIVHITEIDEEKRTMKGDFWFRMARYGDTIKVENGTFTDIYFNQQ